LLISSIPHFAIQHQSITAALVFCIKTSTIFFGIGFFFGFFRGLAFLHHQFNFFFIAPSQ